MERKRSSIGAIWPIALEQGRERRRRGSIPIFSACSFSGLLVGLFLCLTAMSCTSALKPIGPKRVILQPVPRSAHPTRAIVEFVSGEAALKFLNSGTAAHDIRVVHHLASLSEALYVLDIDAEVLAKSGMTPSSYIWKRNSQQSAVRLAEPDIATYSAALMENELLTQQWAVTSGPVDIPGLITKPGGGINVERAWTLVLGDPSIRVAVLDNGLYLEHPDITGSASTVEAMAEPDLDSIDSTLAGHGTRVSSLIIGPGALEGRTGVAGIAPRCGLVMMRIMEQNMGNLGDALEGLNRAVAMGVKISSNSWYTTEPSELLVEAIRLAGSHGHLVVAAAGNSGQEILAEGGTKEARFFPAAYGDLLDNLVVVAASAPNNRLAPFSNWDADAVLLAAPGSYILTAMPPKDWSLSFGTSFSVPYVAGALALALAAEENDGDATGAADVTPAMLKEALRRSVRSGKAFKGRVLSGGTLDVAGLVTEVRKL